MCLCFGCGGVGSFGEWVGVWLGTVSGRVGLCLSVL